MKKHFRFLLAFCFICLLQVGLAHEFWLMPQHFRVKSGDWAAVKFRVGEHFKGEPWGKKKERTRQVTHFFNNSQNDLTAQAIQSDTADLTVHFATEGTHLLAMASSDSYIEMEADKFNEYLKEDGISDILQRRKTRNELGKKSRELYQRCAKTLVQAGTKTDNTYKKNVGYLLEIIPLQNPYTLKPGQTLVVKILFKNKPLPNYAIRTWHKSNPTDKTTEQVVQTNAHGVAEFTLQKGIWMVSLVRMIPATDTLKADYQSYWASLTFEN